MLKLNDALWVTVQHAHSADEETETHGGEIYSGHIEQIWEPFPGLRLEVQNSLNPQKTRDDKNIGYMRKRL